MQSIYQLTEKRGLGGRILIAYPPETYKLVRASFKKNAVNYNSEKDDAEKVPQKFQRDRIERLEKLALAFYETLTHNPDGTISFDKSKVIEIVGEGFSEADVPAVIKRIEIEERIGNALVPVRFLVNYGRDAGREYGYLLPRIRT